MPLRSSSGTLRIRSLCQFVSIQEFQQHINAHPSINDSWHLWFVVFPIHFPPLRERREDIPALLNHFMGRLSIRMNKNFTRVDRQTMEELIQYDWPGNVRELENIVERAMIISQGDTLKIDASWLTEKESLTNLTRVESRQTNPVNRSLAEMERQAILNALSYCHGKVYGNDGAAAALRVKPTTLYGKMRKHKIKGSRQHNAH